MIEWTQRNLAASPKESLVPWWALAAAALAALVIADRISRGQPHYAFSVMLGSVICFAVLAMAVAFAVVAYRKLTEKQHRFHFALVDPQTVAVRVHAEAYIEAVEGRAALRCGCAFDPKSKVLDQDKSWQVPDADAIRTFSIDDAVTWGEQHPATQTRTSVIVADCGNGIGCVVAKSWGGPGTLANLREAMQRAFITGRPQHGWGGKRVARMVDEDDPI